VADRSIEVFKELSVSMQKFDYFILGISIALFAYLGKDFIATKLGLNQSTIELIALTALFVSITFGYARLKCGLTITSINFNNLHLGETRGALTEATSTKGLKYNAKTGDLIDPSKAVLEIKVIKEIIEENKVILKKQQDSSVFLGRFRDVFLIIGFVSILVSKYINLII
jgi:hypothetical protein